MIIQLLAEGLSPWRRLIERWGISFLLGGVILFDANIEIFLVQRIIISYY